MSTELLKEIIPITKNDCFTFFSRTKETFNFPLHFHEEFELNFIINARNAQRIIGDHIGEVKDLELVLVGPNLPHGWFNNRCKATSIKEITIQFHRDLFDDKFLQRNQMSFIRSMFSKSFRGILFSRETAHNIMPRLLEITDKHGFDSVLELLSILHDLSISRNMKTLAGSSFRPGNTITQNSRRVEKVMEHLNHNFDKEITLAEVSKIASMTDVSFSRFFKKRTGKTFVDSLNEIRLGHASRMLIETSNGIAEVAYKCGFNNISNFNRIFKKKKNCTPKEFRETYNASGVRAFI